MHDVLPIDEVIPAIRESLVTHPRLVLEAPPGAGKTTRVPLALLDARLAELVELKFFCDFDFAEIAVMRGVNERTVRRHWDKARLFLRHTLHET